MKQLYFQLTFAILFVVGIDSCEKTTDPVGPQQTILPLTANGNGNAHPAITFVSHTTANPSRYTISVCDSDFYGSNRTDVYRCGNNMSATFPTWSPTGSSVSFTQTNTNPWQSSRLMAVDVTVSNGVAHGSNPRTILHLHGSDSMYFRAQAWCPVSSMNRIAYITRTPTEDAIYIISASAGTPTKIYSMSLAAGSINAPIITWSGDGTKLAFALTTHGTSSDTYAIKVIDASGNDVSTPVSSQYSPISSLQWSHAGLDKILYVSNEAIFETSTADNSNSEFIYGNGNGVAMPFWSPNNSEFLFHADYDNNNSVGGTFLMDPITSGYYSIQIPTPGDWKQP